MQAFKHSVKGDAGWPPLSAWKGSTTFGNPYREAGSYAPKGGFGSVGGKGLPLRGILSVVIWITEGLRLFFVVRALGFSDVNLGLSGAMFVSLIGSLLTAVPLTPGGIGLVETGMGWVFLNVFHVSPPHALAIVLVDRAISVFSIVVLGSIAYVLSSKPRGRGIHVEEVPQADARSA